MSIKSNSIKKKNNSSPLRVVQRISSVRAAIAYLADSQNQAARITGIHQSILSKVSRGKMRLNEKDLERLAVEVARKFRIETQRDNWGLKYFYNSPLRFEVWGVCRNHKRAVEYRIHRNTDRCPKCKAK